jgi:hypothetical protein
MVDLLACIGQVDLLSELFEQAHIQLVLQLFHLHGYGRLGEAEFLGGLGEAEVPGHGSEDLQLAKRDIHD